MSEELDVLKEVAGKLNTAGLPYMLSGSVAMNFYAQPRMTRNIDIVIALEANNVKKFIDLFKDDFYLDEETAKSEVHRLGMFNLIHNKFIIKIDFIIRKDDEFSATAFGRRRNVDIDNTKVSIISAEDLMLAKLNWAKESQSEMQIRDVGNIKKVVENLDNGYINEWVERLGLQEIYSKVL